MRSSMGGLIMPLRDAYDRQVLFEHIVNRARRDSWVDVRVGGECWRAMLMAPGSSLACTSCGGTLSIAHTSAGHRLCTRCRMRALH
jgi:hypothetical protein